MAEPLRALFVNEGALGHSVLGHARVAETFEAHLPPEGLDAQFRSVHPMGPLTRLAVAGLPVLEAFDLDAHTSRWHLAQALRARRLLRSELRRGHFDVLHLHGHTLAFLVNRELRRIPTLLSVDSTVWDWHAMGIWRKVRPYSRTLLFPSIALERRAFGAAARILAFTPWTKSRVVAQCPDCDVVVHHPGIDLAAFSPGAPRTGDKPRVLFVGARFAEKGGDDLLAALGPLAGQTLEIDIVTQDPVAARPGVRVHQLGIDDRAALLQLYREADIFCLPTRGDAVPWAVIEAMSCGLAVIATRVGGIPDLLDDGRVGLLVNERDPTNLRQAIESLLGDSQRREELARQARLHVEKSYDSRVQAARLVEIMREVVQEHERR